MLPCVNMDGTPRLKAMVHEKINQQSLGSTVYTQVLGQNQLVGHKAKITIMVLQGTNFMEYH